jgi:hypothetical protein
MESTLGNNETQIDWFSSAQDREQVLQLVSETLASSAENVELLARRLQYTADGTIQPEPGEPALHVRWQRTQFRACYIQRPESGDGLSRKEPLYQLALINLINGRIVIVEEAEVPFQPSQYEDWPEQRSLVEWIWGEEKSISFRPAVRPAQESERCHYVLSDLSNLDTLKIIADANKPWPVTYKVPSMVTAVSPPTM